MVLRQARFSRLSRVDAVTLESAAKSGQDGAQSSIDMEYGRKTESPGDLAHRTFVLEAEREEQSIGGIQLLERSGKRALELLLANGSVGLALRFTEQLVGVNCLANKILESSPRSLILLTLYVVTARATVTLAEVIENQPPSDDDQP